jgi:hypothetical protein
VPKLAGDYFVCASLPAADTATKVDLRIFVNDAPAISLAQTTATSAMQGCATVRLNANDRLDLRPDTGTFQAPGGVPTQQWLTIDRLTNRVAMLQSSVAQRGLSTSLTTQAGVYLRVPFGDVTAIDHDDAGEFANHVFMPKQAGKFLVCASLHVPHGAELAVVKNGVRRSIGEALHTTATLQILAGCTVVALDPSLADQLDVEVVVDTPGAVASDTTHDWLTIDMLAADHDAVAATGITSQLVIGSGQTAQIPYANLLYGSAYSNGIFVAPANGAYVTCASTAAAGADGYQLISRLDDITLDVQIADDAQFAWGCHVAVLATTHHLDFVLHKGGADQSFITRDEDNWMTIDAIH